MATNYKNGLVWVVWVIISISIGTAIGAVVGSTQLSAGTTMAVVTGMGCVIGLGAFVKAIADRIPQDPTAGWQALTVKACFLLGAINLSVGMVLAPIAICSIVWPFTTINWTQIGMIIGFIASNIGGSLAAMIEVRALANPVVVD